MRTDSRTKVKRENFEERFEAKTKLRSGRSKEKRVKERSGRCWEGEFESGYLYS